ncbi:MAG: hypothetical protein ACI865_000117 [Flavobacteriaceae bacterium]|jgi:hypothetical protein
MKKWMLVVFIGSAFLGFTQDSLTHTWSPKMILPLDANDVWNIDRLENHYISDGLTIEKLDSTGALRFRQSVRSYGNMSALEPINSMKLVNFSEEQQTVCFFDNTLTSYQDCIELIDYDIINARLVCASSQSDRLWVLDQLNSTLSQLVFNGSAEGMSVENLAGILDVNDVSQMMERNEKLYLLDRERGIYEFDLYGSFIGFYPCKNVVQFDLSDNTLFLLINNRLRLQSMINDEVVEVDVPIADIFEFKIASKSLFFRTADGVHKFDLHFLE